MLYGKGAVVDGDPADFLESFPFRQRERKVLIAVSSRKAFPPEINRSIIKKKNNKTSMKRESGSRRD